MVGFLKINNGLDYKVNPIFQKYAQNLKKVAREYAYLEEKVKSGHANPTEIKNFEKTKKAMQAAEQDFYNTPRIIRGGNMDKNEALSEANEIKHKIDYYC